MMPPMMTTVMAITMMSMGVMAVTMMTITMVTTMVEVGVNDHCRWYLLVDRNRHWHRDLMNNRGLRLIVDWLRLRLVITWRWLLRIILLRWHRLRIG